MASLSHFLPQHFGLAVRRFIHRLLPLPLLHALAAGQYSATCLLIFCATMRHLHHMDDCGELYQMTGREESPCLLVF